MQSATLKGNIDKKSFVNGASSYIDILWNPINKENTILFPISELVYRSRKKTIC